MSAEKTGDRSAFQGQKPPPFPKRFDSRALLGAVGRVEIQHRGEVYRLSETRQGKLILTK